MDGVHANTLIIYRTIQLHPGHKETNMESFYQTQLSKHEDLFWRRKFKNSTKEVKRFLLILSIYKKMFQAQK